MELARLVEAANRPDGRGLIFGGAAGIGKSRLLREGVARLDTTRISVWTATANAATAGIPLGGLSQVLPADQPAGVSPAGLLRWAVDALHRQAGGRPIALAIDDAHLLDPLSATLVYYIARSERANVLATVRTGVPVPDPIRALWTDDLVERIELGPLTTIETAELLSQVLGGAVDSASVERLWQLSQGNALLLRELVISARTAGDMTEAYGVWRWTGRLELAPTLAEVIDARIGQLTPEVRKVVELVAFGEPIGLPLLSSAADADAVELAEERQLIRVIREDRRTTIRLAHPLYGEMVRQRCPVTRVRRLLADLAALVEAAGSRRRDDLLRVAVWRLDSDNARDPQQLLMACRQAFATYDIPLATRLGRAAVAAGGGFDAAETLATILMFADMPAEALSILDSVDDLITSDPQRSRYLAIRGIITYWGLTDESTAGELADAGAKLTDPAGRPWVQAVEGIMRLHHLELTTAEKLGHEVLDNPISGGAPRALARCALAHLRAARGQPVHALREVAAVLADAPQWQAETPYIQLALEVARGTAVILAGDLATVDAMVAAEFAGMADAGDFRLGSGYLNVIRAQAARLRGRLTEAGRASGQASAALASGRIFAALANAERAHVAALAGDHSLAAEAIAESDRTDSPTMAALYPWLEQARCWVAACAGDVASAVEILHALIERLRADGFIGHEVFALHDLVRLGHAEPVAERLTELAGTVEGALAPVMARHARAAASPPATPGAAELLANLTASCDGVLTPALAVPQPVLTMRERQIARLAAAGVPSKEIADQLYLSARTVDNHLLRVYAKLGISGRAELAAAMRTLPDNE